MLFGQRRFFALRQSTKSSPKDTPVSLQKNIDMQSLRDLVAIPRRSFPTTSPLQRGSEAVFPPLSLSAFFRKEFDVIRPTIPGVAFGKYVET